MFTLCRSILLLISLFIANCSQPVTFSGTNHRTQDIRVLTSERYSASELKKADFDYNFHYKMISENLTLKAKKPENFSFKQVSRKTLKESFLQGYHGDLVTENFSIKTPDKLDLLLVIDNSSSMTPYQNRLASGLLPLLSHLKNTDWQIMIITTSPIRRPNRDNTEISKIFGCPRLNKADPYDRAIINKSEFEQDPIRAIKRFEWKVTVGETGDPVERGLLAAIQGLKGECGDTSLPWVRPDSHKAVLLLTDEENCGSDLDQNCNDSPDSNPNFFKREAPLGTQFFALLHDKDLYAGSCQDEGYIRKPDDYRAVIKDTGGIEGNICSPSYETILEKISKNIHPINKLTYKLKPTPKRSDVMLEINSNPVEIPFEIIDDTLQFKSYLPQNAELLTVSYRAGAIPIFTSVPIKSNFDIDALEVTMNGQKLSPSEINILPDMHGPKSEKTLVFNRQPPDLAIIEISSRSTEIPLPQSFDIAQKLPSNAMIDTVQISINGHPLSDFKITPDQTTLSLGSTPTDDSLIKVFYETTESRQTVYPITTLTNDDIIRATEVRDAITHAPIASQIVNRELVVDPAEVIDGRRIIASHSFSNADDHFSVTLPHDPIADSLQFFGSENECTSLHQLSNQSIFFPCPDRDLGDFRMEYQYWDAIKTDYDLPEYDPKNSALRVKLDGIQTNNFSIKDGKIHFDSSLLTTSSNIEIIVEKILSY